MAPLLFPIAVVLFLLYQVSETRRSIAAERAARFAATVLRDLSAGYNDRASAARELLEALDLEAE